jgi:transcriptional regulator with XRE-family HTH domain
MVAERVESVRAELALPATRAAASLAGEKRAELGSFLRARRARLQPEEVGLPPGSRRRTPGLRREEVAQLAGVGVTWYTWLEQGRPIQASSQVLDAVARTLGLDSTEREHLYRLAGTAPAAVPGDYPDVPDSVREILDQLNPFPATFVNDRYDLLAWNSAHDSLFHKWHTVPCERRNTLWCCFGEPAIRERFPNFDEESRYLVASLRNAYSAHLGDPSWNDFIAQLSERSQEFASIWNRHEVAQNTTRVKHFVHPEVGDLFLRTTSMSLLPRPGTRVIVYTPEDEKTRHRLALLRKP